MTIFVDTTAFYALLDADDAKHEQAAEAWRAWHEQGRNFITSNYTVVESWSLLQNRLGLAAVRVFQADLLPAVEVQWVNEKLHDLAARVLIASGKRGVSLGDRVSFEVMRDLAVQTAFAFDKHFADEGFTVLPD